jgi:hypothetical protein
MIFLELLCKYYTKRNNNTIKDIYNNILNLLDIFRNLRKGHITLSSKIKINEFTSKNMLKNNIFYLNILKKIENSRIKHVQIWII